MTDKKPPFAIDLNTLHTRAKPTPAEATRAAEAAAEHHGFSDREPKKQRGRKPSPRTGQVHAKVMPEVAEEIAYLARERGVQQGVLIEEAWAVYRAQQKTR